MNIYRSQSLPILQTNKDDLERIETINLTLKTQLLVDVLNVIQTIYLSFICDR